MADTMGLGHEEKDLDLAMAPASPSPVNAIIPELEQGLNKILKFWFPDKTFQEYWFSNEYDSMIRVEFFDLWTQIKSLSCDALVQLCESSKDKLAAILGICICLDQFSRNLIRTDDRTVYGPTDNLCIEFLTRMNLCPDQHDRESGSDLKDAPAAHPGEGFRQFPIYQRIFILLPFRHQRKTHLLNFVMHMIKQMESESHDKVEENIISRFKTATIKDYTKVTDTIQHLLNFIQTKTHLVPDSDDILDPEQIRRKLDHVLDDICLKEYSMKPITVSELLRETSVYTETLKFLQIHKIKNVCISLSGGVDSMVLSLILCLLQKEGKIKNLVAVHVDYGNREVSRDEASVTFNWCAYLGIPFITRRIEHMKRDGPTIVTDSVDRTLYESETKNIRFNLYRQAMKFYGVESVILGHHRDDLAENVLMNVLRGGEVLNLFTMKPHQVIDGVPISRPMLGLPKSDIYEIAHRHEVPYLKDTTPEDCFRGTVRKIVFPALQKIDPAVLLKINKIGTSSDRWNRVVGSQVIDPMVRSAKIFKHGFCIPFKDSYTKIDEEVWKNVLSGIFHGNGVRMISNKNLINFIKWLDSRSGFNRLSNGHMAMSFKESNSDQKSPGEDLLIIRTGITSRLQELPKIEDKSIPVKFDMPVDTEKTVVFNGWTIKIRRAVPDDHPVFDQRLRLEDLMNGEFHYFYRTCGHSTRKDALKNSARYCSVDDDASDYGNITYSMGLKSSDNKRFFKGLGISRYIPMVHFGVMCKGCRESHRISDSRNGADSASPIVLRIDYRYE